MDRRAHRVPTDRAASQWQSHPGVQDLLRVERGAVRKDWGGKLPIALVFPNTYHVGMSSLAVHTLYRLWNARDDMLCERVFTDWMPPFGLESGSPLDGYPVIAFTITYELDYFNVVAVLRASGLPLRSNERDDRHPLVIAGGPAVSTNPEPLAPFLDAVLIGEIEPVSDQIAGALVEAAGDRRAALEALARVPGVYVPNLAAGSPSTVRRQWQRDLDASPCHSVLLTPRTEFSNMGLVEIARGCGRGCRFCLAGYGYRPARERSVESIERQTAELLRSTDRIGLVSAAVSDHTEIDRLVARLRRMGARLSVSSLRVDPISETLVVALAESGTRTLTIAPEAGSQRLRDIVGKSQTEEDVLRAVDLAHRVGIAQLKLYFMVGLPTEELADLEALVGLAALCAERFRRKVTVNVTPFVPKAHTPFQRMEQASPHQVGERLAYIERELRKHRIVVKSESPAWAEVQGTLSRGDRRVADALELVDRPSPHAWKSALAQAGLSAEELLAARPSGTPLPWDFVRYGLSDAE